jgi:hypothetical protein
MEFASAPDQPAVFCLGLNGGHRLRANDDDPCADAQQAAYLGRGDPTGSDHHALSPFQLYKHGKQSHVHFRIGARVAAGQWYRTITKDALARGHGRGGGAPAHGRSSMVTTFYDPNHGTLDATWGIQSCYFLLEIVFRRSLASSKGPHQLRD